MKPTPQFIVYVLGVALLGLFYVPIKAALDHEWLFVVCIVGYLLALRLIGAWVAAGWSQRKARS